MAIDVYLQIDGIKGESNDDRHKDWIECKSVSFGVEQPRSATSSTGGGHTAERCEHRDIMLSKLADLASPVLLQTCAAGRTIPKAIGQRIHQQHHAQFSYDEALVEAVLARCTEVDSGARNVDHILNGSLLPEIAEAVLEKMAQGAAISRIKVGANRQGQFKYQIK